VTRRARSSLRARVTTQVVLLAAGLLVLIGLLLFSQVKQALKDQLAKQGRSVARSIGLTSELALFSGRVQDAADAIDPFFRGDTDMVYVLLLDKEERPILSRIRRGHGYLVPAELVRIHRAMGKGPFEVHPHLREARSGILGFTQVVRVRRRAIEPEPIYEEEPAFPPDGGVPSPAEDSADGGTGARAQAPSPTLPERTRRAAEAEEHALRGEQGASSPGEEVGRVLVGLSLASVTERLWTLARVGLGVILGGLAVLLLGLFGASHRMFRRIERMVQLADHVSRGDLSQKIEVDSDDELGRLGEALNRISTHLGQMLARIQELVGHLMRALSTLSDTATEVVSGARLQAEAVDRTLAGMDVVSENLEGVASDVAALAEAAREGSTVIEQMTVLNQEVLGHVVAMTRSMDETTASIEQMAQSIREVAQSVEDQSTEAARTSRSLVDMDFANREVQATAAESAALTETVRHDAELGAEAIDRLRRGIRELETQSAEIVRTMQSLDQKIRSVGTILGLIDEIAEQVNLLSLNAGIIAAQAGEHGKAFALVAEEIKDLAERTSASTREIRELVKSIQNESQETAHAIARAARNVEAGARLSSQAEAALAKIVESAGRGAALAAAIARATEDQARGSEVVTTAGRRIAEEVSHVAAVTAEQARQSELIARSAQRMREITQSVDRSGNAEAKAAEEVSRTLERVARMVESLRAAQRSQARSADEVRGAIENIRRVAERHLAVMATLERATGTLSAQAEALQKEIERFRL
jgi:methyl-accepting chemotaxis protein